MLADLLFILLFYKQLKVTSFDPALADSIGISAKKWHYLLVTMVSLTVVAAFESVGAILVVAMLIIPAATAHMVTHRLPILLVLSVIVGAACALGGFYAAEYFDASIAGFMAVVGGLIFGLTLFGKVLYHKFAPTERVEDDHAAATSVGSSE
jgi:manganese/zinc/iron transport system permease protein